VDSAHRLPPIDGFIPNSVLIRLLFPEKTLVEEEKSEYEADELTVLQVEDDINKYECTMDQEL